MYNIGVFVLIGIAIVLCVIWALLAVSETKRKDSQIDAGSNIMPTITLHISLQ